MHFLILGARSPVALEWCRTLTGGGHRVSLADSVRWPMAKFSREYHDFLPLPSPRFANGLWQEVLLAYVEEQAVDVVIPNAEEAFYLSHFKPQLSQYCQVWVADFSLMAALHNKYTFATKLVDLPIQAPKTWRMDADFALENLPLAVEELVFKPIYSRFANSTMIGPTLATLQAWLPCNQAEKWMMQQRIVGTEYCSYSILQQGKVLAHVLYQPSYRAGKGAGYYLLPANQQQIHDFVVQWGKKTAYTGQVGFDFIQDQAGQFWVLECNPRGTSGLHFFQNQRDLLLNSLLDDEAPTTFGQHHQAMAFKFAMVCMGLPVSLKSFYDFKKWVTAYHMASDIVFDKTDMKPAWAQILPTVEMLCIAIKNKQSIWEATTHDIEWNGDEIA